MAGPAAPSTRRAAAALAVLALAALLWSAPLLAARNASVRRRTQEGGETAGAGTTTTTTAASSGIIFSAAGLPASSLDGQCRSSLFQSDANSDGRIDRDEYASFANALSGGYFTASACTTNTKGDKIKRCAFDDLPLALQSNFINLACLCERFQFGDGDCCVGDNAHISAAGAGPDEEPTQQEALYLGTVCRETHTAVEEVRTAAPTDRPTGKPTAQPTESPTKAPTSKPTAGPTDQPTVSPTAAPTKGPTARPTAGITGAPTAAPTEAEAPTPAVPTTPTTPTATTPTAAPTKAPTAPTRMITGPLPVTFGYSISNLDGYDAADVIAGSGGNAIAADLRGALGTILIPAVVAETFGGNGSEGARRQQRQRRLGERRPTSSNEHPSPSQKGGGGETQQQQQQQMLMTTMRTTTTTSSGRRRRRRLLVQYDPEVDPAPTVDSVVDIGELVGFDTFLALLGLVGSHCLVFIACVLGGWVNRWTDGQKFLR